MGADLRGYIAGDHYGNHRLFASLLGFPHGPDHLRDRRGWLCFHHAKSVVMEELFAPVICLLASLLIGSGTFCIIAIQEPLGIAALAGFGAFCISLATTLMIWAMARSGL